METNINNVVYLTTQEFKENKPIINQPKYFQH